MQTDVEKEMRKKARIICRQPDTPAAIKTLGADPAVVLWWYLNAAAEIAASRRLLITTGQVVRNVGCRLKQVDILKSTLREHRIVEYKDTKRRREPMVIRLLVHTINAPDSFLHGAKTVKNGSETPDGDCPVHVPFDIFQNEEPLYVSE